MDMYHFFSVVVPTFDRAKFLPAMFESLQKAVRNYAGIVEILIVDDSTFAEAELTKQICELNNAIYLKGSESVREKRNLGIKQAKGEIVLFVDSDCEVSEDIFHQHSYSYQDADETIAGVVGVTEFTGKETRFWEIITRSQFLNAFSFAKRMEFAPWATCTNTSYKRCVLLALGGFEVNFPFKLGADDTDLGLRLNKAGYKIKCNPEAIVFHTKETWNNFFAVAKRAFRWGRMDLHLYYQRHSEKLYFGMPKFITIFLLLIIWGIAKSLIAFTIFPLFVPFIWMFSALLIQAIFTTIFAKEAWRYLITEFLADILGLIFEFGTFFEGIKSLEPKVFYQTVRRGPVLPTFEGNEWVIQTWSMWLGLLLTFLLKW